MIFMKRKNKIRIAVLFFLTAFIGMQMPVSAAGDPPVAIAGGPYETEECSSILFNADRSYDHEGTALEYRWDFNGEWTSWSASPYMVYTWFDDFSGFITLEITDGDLISSDIVPVHVMNVPPFILSFGSLVRSEQVGSETLVALQCFDGDLRDKIPSLDTCSALISWGDGTSTEYLLGVGEEEVIGSHVYTRSGAYDVLVTLTDDDGGMCQSSTLVIVEVPAPPMIDGLIRIVDDLRIPSGIKNGFLSKLESAYSSFEQQQLNAAINKLQAFINLVEAQRGKKLLGGQADDLINVALSVIGTLY
jgi:hypothetical protein